jgi:hypothetical protein
VRQEGLGKLKHFNYINGTRTRDLPASSILPKPTTLPLAPIQRVPGAFSQGEKRQWREAHLSSQTSAEVKNTWIYTSTSPWRNV